MLLGSGLAAIVERQDIQGLLHGVTRALGHKISQVADGVAHGGVLPVDEAHLVAAHQEVGAIEVVVAEHGLFDQGAHAGGDGFYAGHELVEVAGQRIAAAPEEAGDLDALGEEVEGPRRDLAASVQSASHGESLGHLVAAGVIQLRTAVDEAGDLPALDRILVDESIV